MYFLSLSLVLMVFFFRGLELCISCLGYFGAFYSGVGCALSAIASAMVEAPVEVPVNRLNDFTATSLVCFLSVSWKDPDPHLRSSK
jgi:hypothetical protein